MAVTTQNLKVYCCLYLRGYGQQQQPKVFAQKHISRNICLSVYFFKSLSRIFLPDGNVAIVGEGLQKASYGRRLLWPLSSEGFCHVTPAVMRDLGFCGGLSQLVVIYDNKWMLRTYSTRNLPGYFHNSYYNIFILSLNERVVSRWLWFRNLVQYVSFVLLLITCTVVHVAEINWAKRF